MIERTAPNGTIIQFPDGTPEETINQYLELDEYIENIENNIEYALSVVK